MNAIELLEKQHREVEELIGELEDASEGARQTRERLCRDVSDQLAVHSELEERLFYPESSELEERLFYPESRQADTEALLRESIEEHLAMKRLLADIIEGGVDDPQFEARMKVLKEQVGHHVAEEERDLFPKVRRAASPQELEDLGARMQALADALLSEGAPSSRIPGESISPARM